MTVDYRYRPNMLDADQVAMIEAVIAATKIGDPIKTAFDPKISFNRDRGAVIVKIVAMDAQGVRGPITVELSETLPPFFGEAYAVEFIRRTLIKVLTHELDESLYVNGQYVREPHPEGKSR